MKKKLVVPAMLACLLALSVTLTACPTDSSSSGDSKPPTKPAITEVFTYDASVTTATQGKIEAAYDAIWNGNNDDKQLLVALAAKTGKVTFIAFPLVTPAKIAYEGDGGIIIYSSIADEANFKDLLKAELIKARDDPDFV